MVDRINDLLLRVDKPARYSGGEFNTPIIKTDVALRFLMCFPDVYEVAHSNLGIKILYYMLNERPDTACETCYTPWEDMAKLLIAEKMPLFSQETHSAAADFDIIGFSLQYEMSYTNVLYMLKLASLPILACERGENDPIIVGGGPCSINPMPLNPFFDLFSIGDGEVAINLLSDTFIQNKKDGGSKHDFLVKASQIEGIYVPTLNQKSVKRACITSLDTAYFPTKVQIPNIEAVHNRSVLEIFRGCTRGCRFCQAGMIYRPVRERSPETLKKYAMELIKNNGFDELSLSSLSTCDYPYLGSLLKDIKPITDAARVSIALPSTRVDSFEAEFVAGNKLGGITFAPEAGTQRLRDVINKNVTEEDVLTSCKYAFARGYSNIKLYFMIGLPTETMQDIDGIVKLTELIKACFREHRNTNKQLNISLSTSTFVPKPFTPFQWEKQIGLDEINLKQDRLRKSLRAMGVKYNWHDAKTSRIEACLARGDEAMAKVIQIAFEDGCVFDAWSEYFDYDKWVAAFEKANVDITKYTDGFDIAEPLAWDIIEVGASKEFMLSERAKAYACELTPDCRNGCHNCGVNKVYPNAFAANCVKAAK